jgi:dienelactone hydrolase
MSYQKSYGGGIMLTLFKAEGIMVSLAFPFILLLTVSAFGQDSIPSSVPITFISDGFKVKGLFFPAKGIGPFPTVILLQGFPGGEGDLFGLGERMSVQGINAFTFNYRGTWKSEGLWTPEASLGDVKSAISFLKSGKMIRSFSIDTTNLSIVGYSYGGGLALLGSLGDTNVRRVVSIAGGDLSVVARLIEESQEYRKSHQAFLDECMADSTVARGLGGKASHEWLLRHRDDYNLVGHSKELASKAILLIGGWQDQAIPIEDHILPLYRALQKHSAKSLKIEVFDSDHSFNDVRNELAELIIAWIKNVTK